MFKPQLVTAPENSILTLEEAKKHCRVEFDDDDDYITALIAAVTSWLDGYSGQLGRCLISQTWKVEFYDWCWKFPLPFHDVQSVTVKYLDEDGAEQTVSSSLVELVQTTKCAVVHMLDDFEKPSLKDDAFARIWIEFVAGYGDDAADVPMAVRQAALLMIGHWYENREASMVGVSIEETPLAVQAIVRNYRLIGV